MDTLTTTKKELALDALLADDSTFYGDLFPHAVQWHGELYLEDGLHRALRAALQQRNVIHVRVLDLDALTPVQALGAPPPRRSPRSRRCPTRAGSDAASAATYCASPTSGKLGLSRLPRPQLPRSWCWEPGGRVTP